MLNEFSLPYQLEESISDFRAVGWYFHFYSNFKTYLFKVTVENLIRRRVFAASDLVLHCLPMSYTKDARLIWVKIKLFFFIFQFLISAIYYVIRS